MLEDPHTFHCIDYFVIGEIRTCLEGWFRLFNALVDFFKFFSIEFAASSKPPSKENHRKASYPRMQLHDQGAN